MKKLLAKWPLVCYDTKGYFVAMLLINTYADVKAGANYACWLLWRMKGTEDYNQWR